MFSPLFTAFYLYSFHFYTYAQACYACFFFTWSPGFQHKENVVGFLADSKFSTYAQGVVPMYRIMHNGTKQGILHC